MGYDPLEYGRTVERIVCNDGKRKYFRFRNTRFYGGSATADVVGCNLKCVYCWNWRINAEPEKHGEFYSPEDVAKRLITLARRGGVRILRITGGEPTLCPEHLLNVLRNVREDYTFVLETNGILLTRTFVEELAEFPFLHVRVSLKGVDEETFERITGASGLYFRRQIEALRLLSEYGVPARPALPVNLFPKERVYELQRTLVRIDSRYVIEPELVLDYGGAYERLRRAGLRLYSW